MKKVAEYFGVSIEYFLEEEVISVSEIIRTPAIAKIIGCTVNQARYKIRNNVWHFGRVGKRETCIRDRHKRHSGYIN